MDAIEGAIPAEEIQRTVECLRHDPPHLGALVREGCLGNSMTVSEAARQLNLSPPRNSSGFSLARAAYLRIWPSGWKRSTGPARTCG